MTPEIDILLAFETGKPNPGAENPERGNRFWGESTAVEAQAPSALARQLTP